jgi:hypothetical protein
MNSAFRNVWKCCNQETLAFQLVLVKNIFMEKPTPKYIRFFAPFIYTLHFKPHILHDHSLCFILDTRNGTDEYEFKVVSLDGKSWNFAAPSLQVRLQMLENL